MMNKCYLGLGLAAVLLLPGVASAALVSRLGGDAVYDTVLDITWTTNAALSGVRTWDNQVAWADEFSLGGFDDWRLASMSVSAGLPTGTAASVVGCSSAGEAACRDNELGYKIYNKLYGVNRENHTGNHTVGDVTLTGIQSYYWSGTEYDSDLAWFYIFIDGSTGIDTKGLVGEGFGLYGWAVRSGDVSAVPVPAAVWLFGTALIGLVGFSKRKSKVAV
jgi:hypothetical protein